MHFDPFICKLRSFLFVNCWESLVGGQAVALSLDSLVYCLFTPEATHYRPLSPIDFVNNLFRSGDHLEKLSREISVELSKLNVWFKVNKLSLNVAKQILLYFPKKKRVDCVRVTIDSKSLEQVDSTKCFGCYYR